MSGLTQEQILEKLTLVFRDVLDDDTLALAGYHRIGHRGMGQP